MKNTALDTQLDLLEAQFREVREGLVGGSPALILSSGAKLQQLAIAFIQMADETGCVQLDLPSRTLRIRALASGMATLRENLLRQSAYVDRALETLVPATRQQATYAGSATYGNVIRQSGAFSVLSA